MSLLNVLIPTVCSVFCLAYIFSSIGIVIRQDRESIELVAIVHLLMACLLYSIAYMFFTGKWVI